MPFKSQAQRAWFQKNKPDLVKEWEAATPKGKLPKHVADLAKKTVAKPKKGK